MLYHKQIPNIFQKQRMTIKCYRNRFEIHAYILLSSYQYINKRQVRLDWNGEVGVQTVHLYYRKFDFNEFVANVRSC